MKVSVDTELLAKAIASTGLESAEIVVEKALRLLIQLKVQERILDLFGTVEIDETSS